LDEKQDVLNHKTQTTNVWGNDNDTHLIKANGLKKVYNDGVAAVNNNSLHVKKGEVFGLLGPNGAGKSTMFNIMTMDLKRSDGDVKIMDTMIDDLNVTEHGNKMGMCP
jgi:ABC-type multidrug transport system ATPase subunit